MSGTYNVCTKAVFVVGEVVYRWKALHGLYVEKNNYPGVKFIWHFEVLKSDSVRLDHGFKKGH